MSGRFLRLRLSRAFAVSLTVAAGLLGCPTDDPDDDDGPVGPVTVASVQVQPTYLSLRPGDQRTLTATAYTSSGSPVPGRTPRWSSANPAVATVTEVGGVVTAVAYGSATIAAIIDGREGFMAVDVPQPDQALTLTLAGTGDGLVTSVPTGIACRRLNGTISGVCTFSFKAGTVVSLTAQTHPDLFGGWVSAGCGIFPVCQVTMDQPRAVSAALHPPWGSLTVRVMGLPAGAAFRTSVIRAGYNDLPVTVSPTVFPQLEYGQWVVNSGEVQHGGSTWLPDDPFYVLQIQPGGVYSQTVTYRRAGAAPQADGPGR